MALAQLLIRRRVAAEKLMLDKCKITRASGDPVFNPVTGQYESGGAVVYAGKCKVQSSGTQPSNPEAGQVQFTVVSTKVHVPAGTDVLDGDVIELTESALSPALVGYKFRVDGFIPDSWDTAYRVPVEVIL